jgi:hypothetical protein
MCINFKLSVLLVLACKDLTSHAFHIH